MKKLSAACTVVLLLSVFTMIPGCGASGGQSVLQSTAPTQSDSNEKPTEEVKISLLNTKSEIQTQLEDTAGLFNSENAGINLEIIPCPEDTSPFEKASAMYAAGNAPTLIMLDTGDVVKFAEKFANLSSEKWVGDSVSGALEPVEIDSKILGFPFVVEGYGLIYNKKIVDSAAGGNFDPSSVKTRDDLENLFKKIQVSGVAPVFISPMDWSVGAHFLPIAYVAQDKTMQGKNAFLDSLKAGQADLADNKVFTGLLETFDVMMKYNIDKDDPLSGTVDTGPQLIGEGKAGLWFMGNWAWTQISEFDPNGEYGFIPVPISNSAEDYGNSQLVKWASKYVGLDREQNSSDQQAAGKRFLEWMVYSEIGQDALVNKCNCMPAFSNITKIPDNPLSKSLRQYMEKDQTMEYISTLPSDHWSQVGASMQKYLAGRIDKAGLAKEIEDYWKSIK